MLVAGLSAVVVRTSSCDPLTAQLSSFVALRYIPSLVPSSLNVNAGEAAVPASALNCAAETTWPTSCATVEATDCTSDLSPPNVSPIRPSPTQGGWTRRRY